MAVFKVNTNTNYTVMSNTHLRDKNLSLKAKGLLSVMLSLPPAWDYSIEGLCAICKEKETSVQSALKELKIYGYLTVTKKYPNETASGRFEYIYDVYEEPQKQEGEKQDIEKQGVEILPVEIQGVENQGQLNTYKLSTDISSKDILNKDNFYTPTPTHEESDPLEEYPPEYYQLQAAPRKFGKGVVMLSEYQFDLLCEKLSLEELHSYIERLADFILAFTANNGYPPTIKSHYAKILEWVEEDRKG